MLCSACNKNVAVIFINKLDNGKSSLEGLCYNCAKERGINPLEVLAKQANLSEDNIEDMSKQFEDIFNDISQNINPDDLNNLSAEQAGGMPIGNILSSMFGATPSAPKEEPSTNKKKVKTEKPPKAKKRNYLDTFGTNLTQKAKENKLDTVIGRDKEIQRMMRTCHKT